MLFKEALEEFIFEQEIKGLSDETIKNYQYTIKKFLQFAEGNNVLEVEKIDKKLCKSYVMHLKKDGLAESYINTCTRCVNLFFKYLYEEEYINELLELNKIKKKKTVIDTFTDEEVQSMLNVLKGRKYIDVRDKTILMTMIDCGLRAGEIINLRDVDIRDNMTILVTGKGNKERYVSFSPALKKQMMRYERVRSSYFMDKEDSSEYYFLNKTGDKITRFVLQWMVAKVGEMAGVDKEKCFPHNFRHYFAIASLKNGLDLYSLSRTLGHAEITTTTIYTNSIKDEEVQELTLKSSPLMSLKGGRK